MITIDELDWRTCRKLAFLIGLISLCAYFPALDYGFFVDDDVYVGYRNKILTNMTFTDLPRLLFERGNEWEFLPIRDLSYWIDLQFSHGLPYFSHASNLLWYVFCCFAAYAFLQRLLLLYHPEKNHSIQAIAAIGAVFFLSHPAHVEPVVWISGRKDILACAFALMGGSAFVSAIRSNWSGKKLSVALLWFTLAVFSKSVAVFVVMAIASVVLDARHWQSSPSAAKPYLFFIAPLLLSFAALYVHVRVGGTTGIRIENAAALGEVIARASRILASLIEISLIPIKLRLIYDVYALPVWHWIVTGLAVSAGLAATYRLISGKRSLAALGILLLLTPLLPYLQIQPFVTWSMASERFVFQATFGVALLACLGLQCLRPSLVMAFIGVSAVLFLSLIVPRVGDWKTPYRLREHDLLLNSAHHSVVREFVIGHLLPERHFDEARRLASGISNPTAKDLLVALIDASQIYHGHEGQLKTSDLSSYCKLAVPLNIALLEQQRMAGKITDVTLINYFGHLRAYLNNALTNVSVACPKG